MAFDSTAHQLPGDKPLSREFIVRHQRLRIIDGLAQEVSKKGYRGDGLAALLRYAAERPALARTCMVESALTPYLRAEAVREVAAAGSDTDANGKAGS